MGEMIAREIYEPWVARGKAKDLIMFLDGRFGTNCLSKALTEKVLRCDDIDKLNALIKLAIKNQTTLTEIDELLKQSLL